MQISTIRLKDKAIKIVAALVMADHRTQEELAIWAEISPSYLSAIARGDRPLTVQSCAGLSVALETKYTNLVNEFEEGEEQAIQDAIRAHEAKLPEIKKKVAQYLAEKAEKEARRKRKQEAAAAAASEPTPIHKHKREAAPAEAPDYTLAERWLEVVPALCDEGEGVDVVIYDEDIAATAIGSHDKRHDKETVRVPEALRRRYGAKTRAVRVMGRSMVECGIEPGDILFIRCSSTPVNDTIVIAQQDGGTTLKLRDGDVLRAKGPGYSDIPLSEGAVQQGVAFAIWKPKPRRK